MATMIYDSTSNITFASHWHQYRADNIQSGGHSQGLVFIFPSNESHHKSSTSLFSIKSGAGLAHVAAMIGEAGYPTLGLPTVDVSDWEKKHKQQELVEKAICDLYRAAGAGYSFILPTREHKNTKYFDHALANTITAENKLGLEPKFWGGVEFHGNKALANYYVKTLDNFAAFLALKPEDSIKTIIEPDHPYYQAYLDGQRIRQSQSQHRKVHAFFKPNAIATYYRHHFGEVSESKTTISTEQQFFKIARDVLYEYAHHHHLLKAIFSCHSPQARITAISRIVDKLDGKTIPLYHNSDELMTALHAVENKYPHAPLSGRIRFLESEQAKVVSYSYKI